MSPTCPIVCLGQGYAHFIRGRQYWKFDPVARNSLEGYPRYIGQDFFGCRQKKWTRREGRGYSTGLDQERTLILLLLWSLHRPLRNTFPQTLTSGLVNVIILRMTMFYSRQRHRLTLGQKEVDAASSLWRNCAFMLSGSFFSNTVYFFFFIIFLPLHVTFCVSVDVY